MADETAGELPKIEITVRVSGPGGVINYEVEAIRRALGEHGIEVVVLNEYASSPERMAEIFAQVAGKRGTRVILQAYHQPWGG
jgi:hypothetical protein